MPTLISSQTPPDPTRPVSYTHLDVYKRQVVDSLTNAGIPNAPVTISGGALEATITVQTNATGNYTAQVLPATYTVTAGPLPPGYPTSNSVSGQVVTVSNTTTVPNIPVSYTHLDVYKRQR